MQELIERVKKQLEGVELQKFTEEQKVLFKNNYNCKLYFFDYGLSSDGDLIVRTTRSNYNNLLYYMGFDSVKNDYVKMKIEVEENMLVIYNLDSESNF
ncbi:hypothetical protein Dred_2290 [Desulforamulus reducens MI-1]|uniref:Uncharacterized protein n=1 Tax=Desulforamulus reducens (strain ATCC BAA-1160 / DSM 100696 / MI-1) TaxID=349161 RepID=A4J6U7_DESRM|nr:DUF3909 family protein [Desulforamulus reducens]ABO50800.1 hypothetical protein Dred_2290 [Desulforamulus reducens MI-1]